tara:strand:- start:44682 stop:45887 length:1206 start_codon:yes stop_codon:yes gene_type:complete
MSLELAPQQSDAIFKAKSWFDRARESGQLVFRVFGYAGTGKTTIAKMFADMVDGRVLFASYTGKAAHVLREKGCMDAGTLHGLIYIPKSKSAARLRELQREYVKQADGGAIAARLQVLREEIQREQDNVKRPAFALNEDSPLNSASLLVIDEVSMVNEQMGEDLLTFGCPILCLGDPAQLPPVKGGGYFTNVKPDVLLTEVHRQAKGSPVLHLATEVREGRGLGNAMEGIVFPKGQSIETLAKWDQVLVGTNKSRRVINARMREFLGHTDAIPVVGDRLICTRNDSETGLLNGSQWLVEFIVPSDEHTDRVQMRLKSTDDKERVVCEAHAHPFRGEEIPFFEQREAQCFEFAYAMTVHKSQGSQFDSVCLIDESHRFPEHQRRAWLYTGITRAANDLMIIR